MPNQVTIEDVARQANVSPSTVSNLLNGRTERMRPETQRRIQEAIDETGYSPNRTARTLKTGRVEMIGLIVPSVANPFYGSFARHVETEALKHGYQVLLGNSERDPMREFHFAETLWSQGIRGLICGSSLMGMSHLEGLVKRGLKIVAFDRQEQPADDIPIDNISVDNIQAGYLATSYLAQLGHRRIGFITGPIRTNNRLNRLEGYKQGLKAAGIDLNPGWIAEQIPEGGYGDTEGIRLGHGGLLALVEQPEPPTAILTINDMHALGAYTGARDLGLKIPHDISIIGIDDIVLAEIVDPQLTTVRQPLAEMTRIAVEDLINRLEGRLDCAPRNLLVEPTLIIRGSTAAPQHSLR